MKAGRGFLFVALSTTVLLGIPVGALSQQSGYSTHMDREIKALSDDEVNGYLEGSGMSLALAAELNGYPGPKHVLELRQELGLSLQQRGEMATIFGSMEQKAVRLGSEIIEMEKRLDGLFAQGEIDAGTLASLTEELGRLNGRLRGVHLRAHLEAAEVLSNHQRMRYQELRGYDGESAHHGHG